MIVAENLEFFVFQNINKVSVYSEVPTILQLELPVSLLYEILLEVKQPNRVVLEWTRNHFIAHYQVQNFVATEV